MSREVDDAYRDLIEEVAEKLGTDEFVVERDRKAPLGWRTVSTGVRNRLGRLLDRARAARKAERE